MEKLTVNQPKQSLNNVSVGENVRIFDFVNAYNCTIDANYYKFHDNTPMCMPIVACHVISTYSDA